MRRITLCDDRPMLHSAWVWYEEQGQALADFFGRIEQALVGGDAERISGTRFLGMDFQDLVDERAEAQGKLDKLTCLDLLTCGEAGFRVDYIVRVQQRLKDPLSREFRRIQKSRGSRVRLREDILNPWMEHNHTVNHTINHFREALDYRDWLAHGQYWNPKLGRRRHYEPVTIYQIITNLFTNLNLV